MLPRNRPLLHGQSPLSWTPRFTPLEKGGKTSPKSWSKTDHGNRASFETASGKFPSDPPGPPLRGGPGGSEGNLGEGLWQR